MALLGQNMNLMPLSRTDSFASGHYNYNNYFEYGYNNNNYMMMEKRQLFLRSYQFCRKQTLSERIKRSLVRVKRVIWLRLKSARRFRKLACFRVRCGFSYRRRRFIRLLNNKYYSNNNCFW
ncbi:hypothetical protein L484_022681 [Morus notabilis]|uniref:Uncharacterized protein n=1 Tax=Morus notabilis TaxID=981085 RepID=W9R863_9ROSA|nr:uncharacterized protein LOC21405490 [Morus notabilis]EXB57574.1 hypothetical protein L484_022681 [Morus notabilis]